MDSRRILVLAPHPDDEIVACGIAAWRARQVGARVFVLYLTSGVPAPEALWAWQQAGRAARAYVEARVPDWAEVLGEDLLPVWQMATARAAA